MTESTARAERIKPQAVASPSYLWEVAQKPVAVFLPYDVIDRLEKEVVDNFRSLTSRGSEVGGLLIGTAVPGSPALVSIDDFELIPCDYSRGPLYRLSDADMGRFERAVQQHQNLVGFFRSHTRKGLSLDSEDVAFLDARFREAHHVALLVRPYATKASTAGIFIRESGSMRGESSYLEFPFRSSELATQRPSAVSPEPASGPSAPGAAPAASAAAPAPAAPKPAARAQIVPIASRREISLPSVTPVAEPPAKETPVATASAAAAAAAPAPAKAPEPVAEPAPKAAAPAPAPPAKPAKANEKPAPKNAAKAEPKIEPAKAEPPKPEPAKAEPVKAEPAKAAAAAPAVTVEKQKSKTGLIVGVVAAIGFILVSLFVYPGFLKHGAIPLGTQQSGGLSLSTERTGADILVTWNRDSAAVKNASKAVLSIFDGDRHESYEMDIGQLRDGKIMYTPITADVSFRMDVTERGKSTPVSDSVRVLRTRPSPMGDNSQPPTTQAAKPATPAPTPAKPADVSAQPQPTTEADAEDSKPRVSATPTKPFDASSLVQRLHPAAPSSSEVLDAPPVTASMPAASAKAPDLPLGNVSPTAPAPPPSALATNNTANVQKKPSVPTGGQIKQAELVIRKEPEYPKLARQMGIKGIVELTATIGVDGKVKSVKVEHGHPLLTKAATDAVMQWVYRPTLLNGQPVQNDTKITLNFMGEH